MKTIILTVLTFILVSSVWAETPKESKQAEDPKTTLSVAANYLDTVVVNALSSLKVISTTPESKSGDWNGNQQPRPKGAGYEAVLNLLVRRNSR